MWIDVNKELPVCSKEGVIYKHSNKVLGVDENLNPIVVRLYNHSDMHGDDYEWYCDNDYKIEIIAWMHIPEYTSDNVKQE